MKRKLLKYAALGMSAVLMAGVCPVTAAAQSYNEIYCLGSIPDVAVSDSAVSGAAAVPAYLTILPEHGVGKGESIVVTVENGHFDFDAYLPEAYTYIAANGYNYNQIVQNYNSGMTVLQVLNSSLGAYGYELPYQYNLSYVDSNRVEIELFQIDENYCSEINPVSFARPRYNIPLPLVADGEQADIRITVDSNGSGITGGNMAVLSAAAVCVSADSLNVGDKIPAGAYISGAGGVEIYGEMYLPDANGGVALPVKGKFGVEMFYTVSSLADGIIVLNGGGTPAYVNNIDISHTCKTVVGLPVGTLYKDDEQLEADTREWSAYTPVCFKYVPESGVEKGTTLTFKLDGKAEFDESVYPMPIYTRYKGSEEGYDAAAAMLDEGMSVKDALTSFLGNSTNKIPYKVVSVTKDEMTVELFPIDKEDCGVRGGVSYEIPAYNIPIHAIAKQAGTAMVTVSDSTGSINKQFALADITAAGNTYRWYSLSQGDKVKSGDKIRFDSQQYIVPAINFYTPDGKFVKTVKANGDSRNIVIPENVGVLDSGVFEVTAAGSNYVGLKMAEAEKPDVIMGDADNSGILSAADCSEIMQKVLNSAYKMPVEDITSDYLVVLDMDGNGTLTASDAADVLQSVLEGNS